MRTETRSQSVVFFDVRWEYAHRSSQVFAVLCMSTNGLCEGAVSIEGNIWKPRSLSGQTRRAKRPLFYPSRAILLLEPPVAVVPSDTGVTFQNSEQRADHKPSFPKPFLILFSQEGIYLAIQYLASYVWLNLQVLCRLFPSLNYYEQFSLDIPLYIQHLCERGAREKLLALSPLH